MWIILFSILKGIGVFILIILGLVLLLLGMVLFLPIGYRVNGEYKDKILVKGTITWLLFFVRVDILWQEKLSIIARVFGIPVYDNLKPKTKKKKKSKVQKNHSKNVKTLNTKTLPKPEQQTVVKQKVVSDQTKNSQAEKLKKDETRDIHSSVSKSKKIEKNKEVEKQQQQEHEEKSIFFLSKWVDWFQMKYNSIIEKIQNIFKNIRYYYELLEKEETKKALAHCKKRLFIVLKHVLPKKWEVVAELGFEDPSTLGKVYEVLGILYPILGNHIYVIPHWEEEVLLAKLKAKGRITIFVLIYSVVTLAVDSNIRNLIAVFKKGGKVNG